MDIIRPYNAEDNELNKEQRKILEHWAERHNEEIQTMKIYECCVSITTTTGRIISVNETQGCRSSYQNVRSHLYMQENINGKYKRIKKDEW